MAIEAKIIADSISPHGIRLTTMQLKYPRLIHSEFMTHRVFSRNASSSRAIPVAKMLEMIRTDPAMPVKFGKNQPGMQAREDLTGEELANAQATWRNAAKTAADYAESLMELGVHKQVCNRIVEPYQHMSVIVSATEWDNFFQLRDHEDAEPNIQALAVAMREAQNESVPTLLQPGEWHLPYVSPLDQSYIGDIEICKMVSAARSARVSYNRHEGGKPTIEEDIALFNRLVGSDPKHCSPVEHQATPQLDPLFWGGNFRGWKQFRQEVEGQLD
jgi:hypothetical protein